MLSDLTCLQAADKTEYHMAYHQAVTNFCGPTTSKTMSWVPCHPNGNTDEIEIQAGNPSCRWYTGDFAQGLLQGTDNNLHIYFNISLVSGPGLNLNASYCDVTLNQLGLKCLDPESDYHYPAGWLVADDGMGNKANFSYSTSTVPAYYNDPQR